MAAACGIGNGITVVEYHIVLECSDRKTGYAIEDSERESDALQKLEIRHTQTMGMK